MWNLTESRREQSCPAWKRAAPDSCPLTSPSPPSATPGFPPPGRAKSLRSGDAQGLPAPPCLPLDLGGESCSRPPSWAEFLTQRVEGYTSATMERKGPELSGWRGPSTRGLGPRAHLHGYHTRLVLGQRAQSTHWILTREGLI